MCVCVCVCVCGSNGSRKTKLRYTDWPDQPTPPGYYQHDVMIKPNTVGTALWSLRTHLGV